MASLQPILCEWTGEAFSPAGSTHMKRANECYTVGERYIVEPREERSAASHAHYFAMIAEAWGNLSDEGVGRPRIPSPEHLRKYALIKSGFRDERTIVCSSKAEALRLAGFIRPMDEFAIVTVTEATVTVYTAQSQSHKAMGKKRFQESKEAVLGVLAELVGTTPDALRRAGEAA